MTHYLNDNSFTCSSSFSSNTFGRRYFLTGIHKMSRKGNPRDALVDLTAHKSASITSCIPVNRFILRVLTCKQGLIFLHDHRIYWEWPYIQITSGNAVSYAIVIQPSSVWSTTFYHFTVRYMAQKVPDFQKFVLRQSHINYRLLWKPVILEWYILSILWYGQVLLIVNVTLSKHPRGPPMVALNWFISRDIS